jgi:hypothetical protein
MSIDSSVENAAFLENGLQAERRIVEPGEVVDFVVVCTTFKHAVATEGSKCC